MSPSFVFPVSEIPGDRFRLVPFESDKHTDAIWQGTSAPEIWAQIPVGPFPTKEDFLKDIVNGWLGQDPANQLYAVLTSRPSKAQIADQTDSETEVVAGMTAYIRSSALTLQSELGAFIIFPEWHGTGLAFDVGKAMLDHGLASPSTGGLGCRRMVWQSNSANVKSQRLALKLGFKQEGVLRWDRIFRDGIARGKIGNGRALPPGADPRDIGGDSVIFSRCWDD